MTAAPPTLFSKFRASLWRITRVFLVAYLVIVVGMMFYENSLIYFPSRYPEGHWNLPGLDFEDAWITTDDGVKIHGWYVPCEQPLAVILFAHGNAGNLTDRDDLMRGLKQRLRVSGLYFDYRGYGRSEGTPNEAGILADARAARKWLAAKAGIPEREIVLMAESLGGGVMVDLAAHDGARGLVLENTFTSLPDVAAAAMPWLPVKLLMRTRLNSVGKIGQYHGPLLQFHGTRDSIVPFELGQRLFAAANEPKKFVPISGRDHNDPRTETFYLELQQFLTNLPPVETTGGK